MIKLGSGTTLLDPHVDGPHAFIFVPGSIANTHKITEITHRLI
jgi:hypothetical protein